eukprot:1360131-Amorphochlora_amoeboformis.AAC.1
MRRAIRLSRVMPPSRPGISSRKTLALSFPFGPNAISVRNFSDKADYDALIKMLGKNKIEEDEPSIPRELKKPTRNETPTGRKPQESGAQTHEFQRRAVKEQAGGSRE